MSLRPTGNSASAVPLSLNIGEKWTAYDDLPATVRRALQDGIQDWCAVKVRRQLLEISKLLQNDIKLASTLFLESHRLAEEREIASFGERYRKKFGVPYPHTAAGVTPIRDDNACKYNSL